MQGLVTSHFGGNCTFCDELLLTSRVVDRSRVGQIDVVKPDSGATMRFFVFQESGQWCFTVRPPEEKGNMLPSYRHCIGQVVCLSFGASG